MQTTEALDVFEQRLDEVKARLQACQSEKAVQSCTQCPSLFTCTLRKEYVSAAYDSMAKGQGGGFEF